MSWINDLPLGGKIAAYLVSGTGIGLGLVLLPQNFLRRVGQMPLLSPNWMSWWRGPICWIGYGLYLFGGRPFEGYCLVVAGYALDRVDGKMSAAMGDLRTEEEKRLGLFPEKGDLRTEKEKEFGKWFDPLMDKATIPPFLVVFCLKGFLSPVLISLMVVFETVGTLLRPPFVMEKSEDDQRITTSVVLKIRQRITRWVRTSAASGVGKLKTVFQLMLLLICLTIDQQWLPTGFHTTLVGFLSVLFGGLSVASRLRLHPRIDHLVDVITKPFEHKKRRS